MIDDMTPKTLGLKDIIAKYIEHQKEVIIRRTRFDLEKAENRVHILEGYKKYLSESMTFNFETKKGVITKVFTEDAMGYIHGKKIKKMEDNTINIKSGSFTTCSNQEHPHFEFYFGKAKVIPNDKIVTGPAYFKLMETPLPIAVPFGIFPNSKGQLNGILVPS